MQLPGLLYIDGNFPLGLLCQVHLGIYQKENSNAKLHYYL